MEVEHGRVDVVGVVESEDEIRHRTRGAIPNAVAEPEAVFVDGEILVAHPAQSAGEGAGDAVADATERDVLQLHVDDEQDGVTSSTLLLSGSFDTNHPSADGTWVGQGLRPNLVITSYAVLGAPALFSVVGAIDGLAGDFPSVAFGDTAVLDPSLGLGGCALEPSGVVSVHLATGDWVDIVFDPELTTDDGGVTIDDPAACDGCGGAWHRAEELGEVCLDFSSWL